MGIKEFAISYEDDSQKWKATHQSVPNVESLSTYGNSPIEALNALILKLSENNLDSVPQKICTAATAMEGIVSIIKGISEFKNPHMELSFKEGDIATINGELLGMYVGPWLPEPGGEDNRGFVLCYLDESMEIMFKIKLFDDKQLSNIEIIDHVDNYEEYVTKYARHLKAKNLL